MSKRIAITGANGTIGQVLQNGLQTVQITNITRPRIDVRVYTQLLSAVPGHDVIIHLAFDDGHNTTPQTYDSGNICMTDNVYRAAIACGIPRVIMASSVHADSFHHVSGKQLLTTQTIPVPDSPYGAEKVFMESLGRYYATKGLEVICIRFGGVNKTDIPNHTNAGERSVYLSHRDCTSLLQAIIAAQVIPNNFVLLYGVSDNAGRRHDVSNPFGWYPRDSAYL